MAAVGITREGGGAEQAAAADRAGVTVFRDMMPNRPARLLSYGVRQVLSYARFHYDRKHRRSICYDSPEAAVLRGRPVVLRGPCYRRPGAGRTQDTDLGRERAPRAFRQGGAEARQPDRTGAAARRVGHLGLE